MLLPLLVLNEVDHLKHFATVTSAEPCKSPASQLCPYSAVEGQLHLYVVGCVIPPFGLLPGPCHCKIMSPNNDVLSSPKTWQCRVFNNFVPLQCDRSVKAKVFFLFLSEQL